MQNVTLSVKSITGTRQLPMTGEHLTIGRGERADLVIDDAGLAALQASIHRAGGRVWILDEGSRNGIFVNGRRVPANGLPLAHGDVIKLTGQTAVTVGLASAVQSAPAHGREPAQKAGASSPERARTQPEWLTLAITAAVLLLLIGAITLLMVNRSGNGSSINENSTGAEDNKVADSTVDTQPAAGGDQQTLPSDTESQYQDLPPTDQRRKLYMQMSEQERLEFIDERAQHIAMMMGNRPYAFTDDVVAYIKKYVDGYASRANSSSTRLWGEGLPSLYGRASEYAPYIIRSFNARGVPPVVGLYIAMIETEYHDCLESPVGAKGLFQFMPETARGYGVDPGDRCDVKKMAPAAAHYMADRITEFGSDAMSVALGIAGYNRSPDSVRRDLHDVLNSENRERSFWTLVANSDRLDRPFQNENIKYVPKFIAAAIVGETPWAFALKIKPLSTYTSEKSSSSSVRTSLPLDQIEQAATDVMRRISSDDKPYVFSEPVLHEIGARVEQLRNDTAFVSALNTLAAQASDISQQSRRENIEPALVIYTAIAETVTTRGATDISAAARKALGDLSWLKATFGSGLADGSLIIVAAYRMGTGTKRSHPLLASMRRAVKDPLTQRNIWYLRERGALESDAYDFAITFIAVGVIAQQPRQFGVASAPVSF